MSFRHRRWPSLPWTKPVLPSKPVFLSLCLWLQDLWTTYLKPKPWGE